jgi:hypothetical protein
MLERRQPLALSTDERTQCFAIIALGDDVEAAGLAGSDLDAGLEAEVAHQGLQDALSGRECLRRGLRRFQLGALGGKGAAGGRDLCRLRCGQVGSPTTRATVFARAAIITRAGIAARATVATARATVATVLAPWATVFAGSGRFGGLLAGLLRLDGGLRGSVVAGSVVAGSVVAARSTVAVAEVAAGTTIAAIPPRATVFTSRGRGERHRGRGFTLRSGPTKGLAGRGHDAGGFSAHAEDAAAAWREDLEIEVVELGPELVAGSPQRFLDRLAREFLVCTHI